jgi:hypothetical protein
MVINDTDITPNPHEQQWIDDNACPDKTYIFQPPALLITDDITYRPDFLCVETGVYTEVVGSRQAYHQNKAKYALVRAVRPDIKLEICWDRKTKKKMVTKEHQKIVARKLNLSSSMVSGMVLGKKHTTSIDVALAMAQATSTPGINFICPSKRDVYLKACPELAKEAR